MSSTYQTIGEYQVELSGWYSIEDLEKIIEAAKEARTHHLNAMKSYIKTETDDE